MDQPVEYTIVFKNERYKWISVFRKVVMVLSILALAYIVLMEPSKERYFYLALAVLAVGIDFFIFSVKTKKPKSILDDFAFYYLSFCWIMFGFYWISIGLLLIVALSFLVKENFLVQFHEHNLNIKVIPQKTISYTQLQNIVLKDGLLTIDFKNNNIIQGAIIPQLSSVDDENEFNQFCCQQLLTTNQQL